MTRSLYLHLDAPQAGAAETARLMRLADLIKLVAALPAAGSTVAASDQAERAEIKDLILQYRGTAVCDATKVIVGHLTDVSETAPLAEPKAPPFASVTLAPLPAAPANDRGPWHKPQVSAVDPLIIKFELRHEPNRPWPFRLYAPLPLNCGGGLNRVFQSQEAASAALPAFVGEVRAILTRSAKKEAA